MWAYGFFREINFTKIFVSLISRKISSEVLIYHLYFGLVNFLLLHYLGHHNWNLVQRHPNQDHLTMMSWSDHFLSAGMSTYQIEDNWLHWERTKTYKYTHNIKKNDGFFREINFTKIFQTLGQRKNIHLF